MNSEKYTTDSEVYNLNELTKIISNDILKILEELWDRNITNINVEKVKNTLNRILSEKNININEELKIKIESLIDILLDFHVDVNKNDIDFTSKCKKNISNKDILNEILFLWNSAWLKNNKLMISKIIWLSLMSESFKILGMYSFSFIWKWFNDMLILFSQWVSYLSGDFTKLLRTTVTKELSEKSRDELISSISKTSQINSDYWYLINIGFWWYWNILKAFLNNIIPSSVAILWSSVAVFSLNPILWVTASLWFVAMWVSSKWVSQRHTSAHRKIREYANSIVFLNKHKKNISALLSKMSIEIWEKELMSNLSQFYRALPTHCVIFIMLLETLYLSDDILIMELLAATWLVASMRGPIASLIKTRYEDVIKATSDTQLLTKKLKLEIESK